MEGSNAGPMPADEGCFGTLSDEGDEPVIPSYGRDVVDPGNRDAVLNRGFVGRFIAGDNLRIMRGMPSDSVDLVFTSPPYADLRDYKVPGASIKPDEYTEWFIERAFEIRRVLKPMGSFILNISDRVVDGKQQLFVFEIVLRLCRELGFNLVRDYVWYNPSSPPNIYSQGNHGRTKKSHEYCFWFSKGDTWKFHMDPIRKPYSKDMQKYLNGNGKGARSDNQRPSTYSFDCSKTWTDHGGSDPGSVIVLGNNASNDAFSKWCRDMGTHHPARFPERLAEFFIKAGSDPGDIVLDPFSGSGTCAVVAQRLGRRWIGIDINEDYCDLSRRRMDAEWKSTEPGDSDP